MVNRGQIWTLIRGGGQYRVLIISNDEYNGVAEMAIWALVVARDVPHASQLAVRLGPDDPLAGAYVKIHGVVQVLNRSAFRENHGYVTHSTMNAIEEGIREFLELP